MVLVAAGIDTVTERCIQENLFIPVLDGSGCGDGLVAGEDGNGKVVCRLIVKTAVCIFGEMTGELGKMCNMRVYHTGLLSCHGGPGIHYGGQMLLDDACIHIFVFHFLDCGVHKVIIALPYL